MDRAFGVPIQGEDRLSGSARCGTHSKRLLRRRSRATLHTAFAYRTDCPMLRAAGDLAVVLRTGSTDG